VQLFPGSTKHRNGSFRFFEMQQQLLDSDSKSVALPLIEVVAAGDLNSVDEEISSGGMIVVVSTLIILLEKLFTFAEQFEDILYISDGME
jgi:hypothetical protein